MPAPDPNCMLPEGLRIELDADVEFFDGGHTLLNRASGRLLRLRENATPQLDALRTGRGTTAAGRVLGRRLLAAGLAHPSADRVESLAGITVLIPVRDRPESLRRCLGALGSALRVVVVDDGSRAPSAIRAICAEHSAGYVARPCNGGPAAARNTGLGHVDSALVAFLDSDCVTDAEWLHQQAGHFADPLVAAVAPRVVPLAATRVAARSALDLGDASALVVPGGRVSYVPTAALLLRRSALADVGGDSAFDEQLRYGEDVDLEWRLHDAGWWVRYDPSVRVRHDEPGSRRALLARRFHYGTSAGPLARRHPGRLAPVRLSWPAFAALLLVLRGRPLAALAVYAATTARLDAILRRHGMPWTAAPQLMARAFWYSATGTARAVNSHLPGLLIAVAVRRRRPLLAAFALAPPVLEWRARRPQAGLVRWVLSSLADDAAYGAGVWTGAIRARTPRPLVPRFNRLMSPGRPD